jgi:protein-tyrosine sulfotransferase
MWVKPELLHAGWDVLVRTASALPAPWHPLHRNERFGPFFIIGSGRSGTTLLRRMLQAHPDVHVPPETAVLGRVIKLYRQSRGRPWEDIVHLVLGTFEFHPDFGAFEMELGPLARHLIALPRSERSLARILDGFYRDHARTQGRSPRLWGDKSPINTLFLERIHRVFPDMAAIHLVRDGADVVQSFVSTGVIPSLDDAADRWVTAVRCAHQYGRRHPERFLEIRYEALVGEPEPTIRRVCDHLGLGFLPAILASESIADSLGDVPRHAHHDAVKGPVSAAAVGKGRKALSEQDRVRVGPRLDPMLRELGYAALDPSAPPWPAVG